MSYSLFIATTPPLYSSASQDLIEAAMSAANAELTVKIIFVNEGCWQLTTNTNKAGLRKDINKQLDLLTLYEIDDIYYYMPHPTIKSKLSSMTATQPVKTAEAFNEILNNAENVLVF